MPLRAACLALVTMLGSGCTDLVTVDVGPDRISPITFERELVLGGGALAGCPAGESTLRPDGALGGSASITPVATGCLARVVLRDALLVDRETVSRVADSIEGFDTTALVGFDVAVDELTIRGDGVALGSATIAALEIRLESEPVLAAPSPESVTGDRVALPEPVVDAFLEAVELEHELRVDVEVRLTFRPRARLPDRLGVRLVLQPILRVDVVRAAL
jgi:hypothetical protein